MSDKVNDEVDGTKAVVVRLGTVTGRPVEIRTKDGRTQYKCQYCGKWLFSDQSIDHDAGSYCESLRESGLDEDSLQRMREARTVEKVPTAEDGKPWVKLTLVGKFCSKHNVPISRLVKAFGNDRGTDEPLREEYRFVYCGRARYVHPWCMTKEAIAFLQTLGPSGSPDPSVKDKSLKNIVKPADKLEEALAKA